ncbi:hypothetical protein ACF3DV_08540 [Chlorogloeopsis fritschii PCC 9212]|uniref:hypothetical protein n=1 Tax=Chlorogloeopsis fritschii TaxID=1124 RepID=UPI0003031E28|nr:hypothetical protein [Chlorogloeopsis fritschii]
MRHQLYSDLKFVKKVLPTKKYLEKLLVRGCNWVSNYLWYNRNIEQCDRTRCDGVTTQR